MMVKDECPRSLQVRIKVNVNQEEQTTMDAELMEAKKTFEKKILAALIKARQQELSRAKTQLMAQKTKFAEFMSDRFNILQQHQIPLDPLDASPNEAISLATHEFEKRAEEVNRVVRTQMAINNVEASRKKQARDAQAQEDRINTELQDPQVNRLIERMESLEKKLNGRPHNKTTKKTQGKKARTGQRNPNRRQQNAPNRPFRQRRFGNPARGPPQRQRSYRDVVTRPRNRPTSRNQRPQERQDRDQGNRKPRRRFTNTMNRSGFQPPNSRRRQN